MVQTPPSSYHANDGAAYEWFLGRWTSRLATVFADFADPLEDGGALDVGCGTGSLATEIARREPGREVIGVDVSEPYLAFAGSRCQCANLRFQHADASALPFADGAFGITLAQLVHNFLPDPVAATREMVRVTRPGGVVAAAVWDFGGGLVYQRLFWDTACAIDPSAAAARNRLFSHALAAPNGLARLWSAVGMADVEGASLTIRMDYASFDDYWEPLQGGQGPVGAFMQSLEVEARANLRSAVRRPFFAAALMARARLRRRRGPFGALPQYTLDERPFSGGDYWRNDDLAASGLIRDISVQIQRGVIHLEQPMSSGQPIPISRISGDVDCAGVVLRIEADGHANEFTVARSDVGGLVHMLLVLGSVASAPHVDAGALDSQRSTTLPITSLAIGTTADGDAVLGIDVGGVALEFSLPREDLARVARTLLTISVDKRSQM